VSHRRLLELALLLAAIFCCARPAAYAQEAAAKTVKTFKIGETDVKVNVYERAGAAVTLFAPHHNEQGALKAAREAVAARGGRFVEVEALDEAGAPARRLRFRAGGRGHSVDPNRIYTANGRRCLNLPPDAEAAVKAFADSLLALLFAPGGARLREGETLFVAVHNNGDVEKSPAAERDSDLSAVAFVPRRVRGVGRGRLPLERRRRRGQLHRRHRAAAARPVRRARLQRHRAEARGAAPRARLLPGRRLALRPRRLQRHPLPQPRSGHQRRRRAPAADARSRLRLHKDKTVRAVSKRSG
jgi:hypothetical protein